MGSASDPERGQLAAALVTRRDAELAARQLLKRLGFDEPPIDVEEIALRIGARLAYEPFDGNVSGMVVRADSGDIVIGINQRHARVRQRFSIAHEIGHCRLHPGRPILDRVRVNFRDDVSAQAVDRDEMDANAFAAELLMPADQVRRSVREWRESDVQDYPDVIDNLARRFDVSTTAMTLRLVNLGILPNP